MSRNLVFYVNGGGSVDFPFQTPTAITNAFLAAQTQEEKLNILDAAMKGWGWNKRIRIEKIKTIKELMDNPSLTCQSN